MQSSSVDNADLANTQQALRQRNPPASLQASRPVVSDDQVERIARGGPIELVDRPKNTSPLDIKGKGTMPTAEEVLNASITDRLAAITKPKQRHAAHMMNFLKALSRFDPNASTKAEKTANEDCLSEAVPEFIQTFFATLEEVEGPQKVAGQILNMHNWQLEANNLMATTVVFALALGVEFTKHPPKDKDHPPPVAESTVPAFVPNAIGLPLNLAVMWWNAEKGAKDIQPALAMQRATRALTPTSAGRAVKVTDARKDMRQAHKTAEGRAASGDDSVAGARAALEEARDFYDAEHGMLQQRSALYGPENNVKAVKNALLAMASLTILFSSDHDIARVIPQLLIAQTVAYVGSWRYNYTWAGPKRDRLLRDGALKVDFAKEGVEHAKRLANEQGGTITHISANDPVWEWARGIYKNGEEVRLDMLDTRIQEKIEDALHEMSPLLGISHADLLRFNALTTKHYDALQAPAEEAVNLSTAEAAELKALQDRFNDSLAEQSYKSGTRGTPYAECRAVLESWSGDREKLKQFMKDVSEDKPSEVWKDMSTEAKEMLNSHLVPSLELGAIQMYREYMKGPKSKEEFVRFTHEVANVTVRDWRLLDPDRNLKLNRSFAYLGAAGSLGSILKGNFAGIIKGSTGASMPKALSASFTGVQFLAYLNEIFKQGQAVNLTIRQKDDNKKMAPSKYEYKSVDRGMAFVRALFQGTVITTIEGVRWAQGARERGRVMSDIRSLPNVLELEEEQGRGTEDAAEPQDR